MNTLITIENKLLYFEYIISKLLGWYEESGKNKKENDLSILKALKLLFFVSAIRSKINPSILIDDVFNSYFAMPYGHVEMDIYNEIKKNDGELSYFKLNNYNAIETKAFPISPEMEIPLNKIILQEIDKSIDELKKTNEKLITFSASTLVDISHQWYSWQYTFNIAKLKGKKIEKIEPNIIKQEDKIFNIYAF